MVDWDLKNRVTLITGATGYLLLAHASNEAAMRRRCAGQQAIGVGVEWLAPEDSREVVPALAIDGVAGALWTREDGYLNPGGALQGFIERSRELGAVWRQDEVVGLQLEGARPTVNLRDVDEGCELDHVIGEPRDVNAETVLSVSFGMGGQNASVILKRF